MTYEDIFEAVLVILGAAYVLSQLTGDPRDGSFVKTIEAVVQFIRGRK